MEEGVFLSINEGILEKLKEASRKGLERDPEVLNGKTIEFSKNCGSEIHLEDTFDEFFEFKKNKENSIVKVLIQQSGCSFQIMVSDNLDCIGILGEWMTESIREHLGPNFLVSFRNSHDDIGFVYWTVTL